MECIFNELSVQLVGTILEANEVMTQFVQSVVAAQPLGLQGIRIHEAIGQNLFALPLAAHYTVGSWLSDTRIDQVVRDRFRQIVANPPLLSADEVDALSAIEQSMFCLHEPAGKPEATGFGIAYLSNRLLVSLLTTTQWSTHQLTGWHWFLEPDGKEQSRQVDVRHFATAHHLGLHSSWIQQQQEGLQRSVDVWEKRAEFFPHLVLCGEVQKQLRQIGMSGHLAQIIARLRTLDEFVATWKTGSFNSDQLNDETNLRVSGESASTMRLYSGQRRFKLPDGRRELFEFHVKTGDLRFHFYADNPERKVYVGYIGPHLPTATG